MVATCRRPATSTQESGGRASRFWAESSRRMEIDANGRWPPNCGVGFHDDPARLSPLRKRLGRNLRAGSSDPKWDCAKTSKGQRDHLIPGHSFVLPFSSLQTYKRRATNPRGSLLCPTARFEEFPVHARRLHTWLFRRRPPVVGQFAG